MLQCTNLETKPFARDYIAELLSEISNQKEKLNKVEAEELTWFEQEFSYELGNRNEQGRWHIFSYEDSLFNFKAFPIAGYGISSTGSASGHERWWGAGFYATYSDWFGGSLDLRDKGEFGDNIDKEKDFSPIAAAWYKGAPNAIEYSDVKGSVSFDWHWGSLSLIKDYFQWGHGQYGNLILSSKAPSYPHLRLQLKPVDWLRFYYVHGWLNSQVIDSASSYYTNPGSQLPELRERYIDKYIAANMVTVSPWQWLDVSLGNAVIYSGPNFRPEFLIPFMFYKFLDHNTGRGNTDDTNGAMYFDVAVKYPQNFLFYTTLFIDVTEIRNILKNEFYNTWFGVTLGAKHINFLADNLDISFEYTRISPWVYEHKDQTTTYKHIDHTLGHWLGQNADQLRLQFNYQFMRGLKFNIHLEQLRKGGLEDIYFAYRGKANMPFLYSPLRKEINFGLSVSYEYMHDLFVRAGYKYSHIKDEDISRTPEYLRGHKNSLYLTLHYGL